MVWSAATYRGKTPLYVDALKFYDAAYFEEGQLVVASYALYTPFWWVELAQTTMNEGVLSLELYPHFTSPEGKSSTDVMLIVETKAQQVEQVTVRARGEAFVNPTSEGV